MAFQNYVHAEASFGGPNNYKHKLPIRKIITVQFGIVLQVTEFSTSAVDVRILGRKILSFPALYTQKSGYKSRYKGINHTRF